MPGDETAIRIPAGEIERGKAWSRVSVSPEAWLVALPDACIAELDEVAARVRVTPRPVEELAPEAFPLAGCARIMAQVRTKLEHQIGLAVVDRIPVDRYGETENRAIGWLLARMLGQVVAQKQDGTRLYDVRDSSQALGYGVRRSVTNLAQPFHTDGGWLWMPPAFVGLFCVQSAGEGGLSRFVSLVTVHNEMRRRHPELLARLYHPFAWDRQAEHGPDGARFATRPVYEHDGRTLTARYYEDYIVSGYKLAGAPLDDEGRQALATMRAIVDNPDNWVQFRIETGQLQYLNNRQFAHSRTAFADTEAGRKRHMLRLWNRDEGTVRLDGGP